MLIQDVLFEDAMALHKRFCERQNKPHLCAGQATLKRGEVCLDCPLCGEGEKHPWQPQLVKDAEDVLSAAGFNFYTLNRESQTAVLVKLYEAIKKHGGDVRQPI